MTGKIALVALALVLVLGRAEAGHNYRDALTKSILFFEGQRSGKLPFNQRMKWRGDSGLSDGAANYVDMRGGYYDAGDNVKFGFPMAFTTTMLSWSVLEFGGKMGNDLQHAKEAIRWATDYLLKAAAYPGTLYVQVGEPSMDHKCWERPEDMDTPRSVYKIDAQNPGSDVASETAAALAAASMVFKSTDAPYSKLLLQTAVRVFALADEHRGAYSDSLASVVCPYYCSYSGYPDELLWGATWLAKATRSQKYFNYIQSNGPALGYRDNVNVLSWDQKHLGTRILLAREVLLNKVKSLGEYQGLANNFICSLLPGTSSARYSPGGLLFNGPTDQCNLQYVTSTTFLLFTYAKYLSTSKQVVTCANTRITPSKIRFIAKRQVDYILGDNPLGMSYMVGYGPKFPQHIHHRGSSLPSIYAHPNTISCNDGFNLGLYSSSPNPNVLDGAVIGGPDNNDQFRDDRNDYSLSEPATYINAPLVGSLAYLARS